MVLFFIFPPNLTGLIYASRLPPGIISLDKVICLKICLKNICTSENAVHLIMTKVTMVHLIMTVRLLIDSSCYISQRTMSQQAVMLCSESLNWFQMRLGAFAPLTECIQGLTVSYSRVQVTIFFNSSKQEASLVFICGNLRQVWNLLVASVVPVRF